MRRILLVVLPLMFVFSCNKGQMNNLGKYCGSDREPLVSEVFNHLQSNPSDNATYEQRYNRAKELSDICCKPKCVNIALDRGNSPNPVKCAKCIDGVINKIIRGELDPLYLKMDTEKCCEGD